MDIIGLPEAICSIFHPSSVYAQLQVLLVHPEYLKVNDNFNVNPTPSTSMANLILCCLYMQNVSFWCSSQFSEV